eukprot:6184534-Pleurochrysis_carterae.AAC.1
MLFARTDCERKIWFFAVCAYHGRFPWTDADDWISPKLSGTKLVSGHMRSAGSSVSVCPFPPLIALMRGALILAEI